MTCPQDDSGTCCGLCDMNVVVVIATHDRKDITTRNIKSLQLQKPQPKIVIVCSSLEELEYYKAMGVTVVHHANTPLGAKWQAGVNVAAKMKLDALVILGSDDILSKNYLVNALSKIKQGFDFVGCTHWYVHDVRNEEYLHCKYINLNEDFPIGSGKVYSAGILERIRYKLFDTMANRKLDDVGHKKIQNQNAKIFLFRTPEIMAYKGRWHMMNPTQAYKTSRNVSCTKIGKELINNFNL